MLGDIKLQTYLRSYKEMYKILIVLAILGLACGVRLTSSGTWSVLTFPANANAVYVDKLNAQYPDVIPGVKWIWDNNGHNTPRGDRIRVEHTFWSKCGQPAVLSIAAYGSWSVYVDGSLVKSGTSWK